jgi:death-on-curing family protein
MDEILIYRSPDDLTQVEVKFRNDTVWLTQSQIGELFQKERTVITKHISNIFRSDELDEKSNVQKMHLANSDKPVRFYSLDVIISVGYRVNSKKGTQFRQWATQRLKDYLIKGYTVNQQRLQQLDQIVNIIQHSGSTDGLQLTEAKGLLDILGTYTRSFVLLNQYDSNSLKTGTLSNNVTYKIEYAEAKEAIAELKHQLMSNKEATALFGNEKDQSFEGTLNSVVQTFGGEYVYSSIEEQAAHLLYFVIKNHPFSDGNKRIGAFLFIWFLEKNKHRFKKNGEIKINDNALTALALLVAQSDPAEKELMTSLICNLISNG